MTHQPDFLRKKNTSTTIPWWRGLAIFVLGLLVGWLLIGWVLFPVRDNNITPADLPPELVNDYLLMNAESYATTHDLRTAAKRLRYWDDENVIGPKIYQLAQDIERDNPAAAAYLRLLAHDLHLPATATASSPAQPGGFNILWLLGPLLALIVLASLIVIAQRLGWLQRRAAVAEIAPAPPRVAPAHPVDASFYDAPGAADTPAVATPEPVTTPETEVISPEPPIDNATPLHPAMQDAVDADSNLTFDDALPLTDEKEAFEDDLADLPPYYEPEPPALDAPIPPPSRTIPLPPPAPDEADELEEPVIEEIEEGEVAAAPQVLRFDGDPTYNTIIAIEVNDDYLGEFGLSAGQVAPKNPNLVLTLEVWLFDKSDTQTVDVALTPPVIASDPDLKARYVKEEMPVVALIEGQPIQLETAELRLDGRVRRVRFGASTSDGVPVIEYAEIELLGRRK